MRKTDPFENKVAATLRKAGIKKVITGVSGGADSMALLLALKRTGAEIYAAHCNFHLRGAESQRDMEHVRNFCEKMAIPLSVKDFNVEQYIKEHRGSIEMACRNLRYDYFKEQLVLKAADRICVAHTADDQAETVLLNLMRGAGVSGMRGMLEDTGTILRPLLDVNRRDIEDYLSRNGVDYVTDSTNLSSNYRRNFLRNEIIPLLRTRWPEATRAICRTASNMRKDERMLEWLEDSLTGSCKDNILPLSSINGSPDPEWLIRRFVIRLDQSSEVWREIFRTVFSNSFQTGKQWQIRNGVITLERDGLEFRPHVHNEKKEIYTERLDIDDRLMKRIRCAPLTELWCDLSADELIFRAPVTGDRIKALGYTGSTLVSKVMKDAKLSYSRKLDVIVAESRKTGEIIWVEGLKRSRLNLVTPDTKFVYRHTIGRK